MFAACKAALSGLAQSGGGGGGRSSPSDKQVEAFVRALAECHVDEVAAHVVESRGLLLLQGSLRCHPARSSAWHLAAGAAGPRSGGGGAGGDETLLGLLLRLHRELQLPAEGLPDLLNAPNKRGQTCLHCAAARGNAPAVRLLLMLLGLGADSETGGEAVAGYDAGRGLGLGQGSQGQGGELLRPDKSGRTALHLAAAAGSEECVRLLLSAAEAADEAARTAAAANVAAAEAVASGLAEAEGAADEGGGGGSVAAPRSPSPSQSPLGSVPQQQQPRGAVAARSGGTVLSRLVSAPDLSGLTALHFATAAANSVSIVRRLLAAGAPYTAQAATDNLEAAMPCNAGWTCLHVAAMRGRWDVAAAVLRHHSSLSPEQQVAAWSPGKHCRSSDPRVITDRRGTSAAALAAARGFADLAALLDPAAPLSYTLAGASGGGEGPVGPDGREVPPPAMFMCPITQEVMVEPVCAADGFTYERAAIARWLAAGKLTSPMTNLPLAVRALYPNNVVKSAIKEWRQEHEMPDRAAADRRRARQPGLGLGLGVKDAGSDIIGGGGRCGGRGGGMGGGSSGRDPFLAHLRARGL